MNEEFEFYSVDPYDPLDPKRDFETWLQVVNLFSPTIQASEQKLAKLFRPRGEVSVPGCLFPLEVALVGGVPLLHCKTNNDLNQTLLRDPSTAKVK